MDLQLKLSLQRQLMGLSPKYNDIGLGRDMAWSLRTACTCKYIVVLTEVSLSKICVVIFFFSFF